MIITDIPASSILASDTLQFNPGALLGIKINPASYTLVLPDVGMLIRQNVNIANTVTIPLNSAVAFPLNIVIMIDNMGIGQTTIVGKTGVVINSAGNKYKLKTQFSVASLIHVAKDTWLLSGDLI